MEYHRKEIDSSSVDFKEAFPIDQLTKANPLVKDLIAEVEKEFEYRMNEFQCSWAVTQFICVDLEKYNKAQHIKLEARE